MEKKNRIRRTNIQIKEDIIKAIEKLVSEKGFQNITLRGMAAAASVDTVTIYNWYHDLDGLFYKFTSGYHTWMLEFLDTGHDEVFGMDDLKQFVRELIPALADDAIMKKIMLWELEVKNRSTTKSSKSREVTHAYIMKSFETDFQKSTLNFDMLLSLILGGIYYQMIYKKHANFGTINFNDKKSQEALYDTIDQVMEWAKSTCKPSAEALAIAKRMKSKGIDVQTIGECTNLSLDTIQNL